jgi:phospholipid/cholesterol/gamma-HCH transport system permease protein
MGAWGASLGKMMFSLTGLLYDSIAGLLTGGRKGIASSFKQIVSQVLFTGVEAFWLVGIIGLLCGITIIIQAMTNMPKFGVGEYFGNILIIVVIRELGPFFT